MKRYILLLATLFISTVTFAQWSIRHIDADELRGQEECYFNFYNSPKGDSFSFGSTQPLSFIIGTRSGIFNYGDDAFGYHTLKVIVGYYVGKELVDKATETLYISKDGNSNYAGSLGGELANKVVNHLKTKGDVRIIAPKYSGSDYDVRIPMNKNLKVDSEIEIKETEIVVPKLNN